MADEMKQEATRAESHAQRLREVFEAEGIVAKSEPAVAPPAEGTPAASTDPFARQFSKLTTEKEAMRKERESYKPYEEARKVISPEALQALIKAKTAGDPMGLLAAMGFSYTDVVRSLQGAAGGKVAPKDEEAAPQDEPNSEVAQLRQELAALRNERDGEKFQGQRKQVFEGVKGELYKAKDKFPLVIGMDAQEEVLKFIEHHVQRTGSPPGDTFEESIAMAAAEVEGHLTKQKEKWSKVLTNTKAVPTVETKATETPASASESTSGKTLNNRMVAPSAMTTRDKESRIAEVLKDNSLWGD